MSGCCWIYEISNRPWAKDLFILQTNVVLTSDLKMSDLIRFVWSNHSDLSACYCDNKVNVCKYAGEAVIRSWSARNGDPSFRPPNNCAVKLWCWTPPSPAVSASHSEALPHPRLDAWDPWNLIRVSKLRIIRRNLIGIAFQTTPKCSLEIDWQKKSVSFNHLNQFRLSDTSSTLAKLYLAGAAVISGITLDI